MGMLKEAYDSRAAEFVADKQVLEAGRDTLRGIAADFAELQAAYAAAGLSLKIDTDTSGIDSSNPPRVTGIVSGLPRGFGLCGDSRPVPFSITMKYQECEIILGTREAPVMWSRGFSGKVSYWLAEFVKTIEAAASVTPDQTVSINQSLKKTMPALPVGIIRL